jgi:alpha/beta superfamily hydrolase
VEPVTIVTDDGLSLEGELRLPEEPPRASAVLCHPHPRHGGSKDHPILWAVRAELSSRGLAALSFNFRGNMGSEGSYGGGVEEVADARAAIDVVRGRVKGPTFVFGWSFGASVALREAVEDRRVEALALLGFPLGDTSLQLPPPPPDERLDALTTPVLLVAGDSDPFCPVDRLLELGGRIPKAEIEILRGGDHYFPRREREVAALVGGFAERTVLASGEGLPG